MDEYIWHAGWVCEARRLTSHFQNDSKTRFKTQSGHSGNNGTQCVPPRAIKSGFHCSNIIHRDGKYFGTFGSFFFILYFITHAVLFSGDFYSTLHSKEPKMVPHPRWRSEPRSNQNGRRR